MIKISVIVPVFNPPHEMFEKHLNSVLGQNGDYEFIYINDGSTDSWIGATMRLIVQKDDRVKYIEKKNSGVSDTRNVGIAHATGDFITFVDADDYIEPGCLKYMYDATVQNSANVSIFGFHNGLSKNTIQKCISNEERIHLLLSIIAYRTHTYCDIGVLVDSPWAKLFSRKLITQKKISFSSDLSLSEDALFDLYCYQHAKTIYLDNTVVYNYVTNNDSSTHTNYHKYVEMIPKILKEEKFFINSFYPDNDRFQDALAVRAFIAVSAADYCYFSSIRDGGSIWRKWSEFRKCMSETIVRCLVKRLRYSQLNDNRLYGLLNKVKLYFYKNDLLLVDVLLFRLFHYLKHK